MALNLDSAAFDFIQSELGSLPPLRNAGDVPPTSAGGPSRVYPPPKCDLKVPGAASPHTPSTTEPDNYFTICVQKINHPRRPIQINVTHLQDIGLVKQHVSRVLHVPVDDLTLLFKGKVLNNSNLVSDYGLQSGDVLHMRLKKSSTPSGDDIETGGNLDQAGTTEQMDPCFDNWPGPIRRVSSHTPSLFISQPHIPVAPHVATPTAPPQQDNSTARAQPAPQSQPVAAAASSATSPTQAAARPAESTLEALRNNASPFRVDLQKLLYQSFPPDQATAVSKLLDSYFSQF